jgi:endoglucanase
MNRRNFFWAGAPALAACALGGFLSKRSEANKPRSYARRGVSLSGPEFGSDKPDFSNEHPGVFARDYTYNSEATVAYFCARDLPLLRLPLRWERLQPRLGQPLDEAELGRLQTTVAWARKHDGKLILDIHNYGRYVLLHKGNPRNCVIDQPQQGEVLVTRQHFADLWRRIAIVFQDEPTIYAYGLMNEPHDMGSSDWKVISQAAVDVIRRLKDTRLILVAGDGWSNARRFAELNGPRAWIEDPARNIAYEAHCYFDEDSSGHYARDYASELARDPGLEKRGVDRLRPFVRWCQLNRVKGFLGEFGIPRADSGWQTVLARFLEEMDRSAMEGCYWAAGEWWGDYPLSIQPSGQNQQPAPQLHVLTRG